jgi:hypothetical protein
MAQGAVRGGSAVEVLGAAPGEREKLAGVLGALEGIDADDVHGLLGELERHEAEVLAWIGRSPQNVERFLAEPLAALGQADPGIDQSTLRRLGRLSEAVAASMAPAAAEAVVPAAAGGEPTLLTQGWDLVAGITQAALDEVMSALYDKGEIPKTISAKVPIPVLGDVEVTLEITAPTIDLDPPAAKGQPSMVGLTIPFTSGTIKGSEEKTIPPGSIEIVTEVAYVQLEETPDGTTDRLSFDLASGNAIYEVVIEDPSWPQTLKEMLATALKSYFQSLAPASFYLGDVQIPKEDAELAPAGKSDFAIQIAAEPGRNVLLLLMQTPSSEGPGSLDFSKVSSLVPAGQKSVLYVSNRLLVQKIVAPAVAGGLEVPLSSFTASGNAKTSNSSTFSGQKQFGGEYEPELVRLELKVGGGKQILANYKVLAYPISGSVGHEAMQVEVDGGLLITPTLEASTQTITFATAAGSNSGSLKFVWWVWTIFAVLIAVTFGTGAAILGIVLAIVVPIVVTQLRFPVNLPPQLLKELQASVGSFAWPGQEEFPLTGFELPGDALFLGEPTI